MMNYDAAKDTNVIVRSAKHVRNVENQQKWTLLSQNEDDKKNPE